jgi:hypothetical protein
MIIEWRIQVKILAVACVREGVHQLINPSHGTACAAYLEPTSQIRDLERARAVLRAPVL